MTNVSGVTFSTICGDASLSGTTLNAIAFSFKPRPASVAIALTLSLNSFLLEQICLILLNKYSIGLKGFVYRRNITTKSQNNQIKTSTASLQGSMFSGWQRIYTLNQIFCQFLDMFRIFRPSGYFPIHPLIYFPINHRFNKLFIVKKL